MSGKTRLRCAIYTRKSTEEGLDQEFNSLDAQREACAAYIASQVGLGWKLVPVHYDDGGISGGTMERPALQRLLADIAEGKVDVVVVYKIDRLTRSLMDFSRIVEIFDANTVSFVSVTQQFNTTTSMGRLTLNVLLSFAQFEREVTAERIRDKIAASKKKGMWMGGRVPLGYKVVDRKLIIDEAAAATIQHLFRRYLELGSVTALSAETNEAADPHQVPYGRLQQGGSSSLSQMGRGQLYHLLSNPIYIGKLRHHDQIYDGEHAGIIEPAIFDAVQTALRTQAPQRRSGSNNRDLHLLTGLVFDDTGDRLSPTHANNHGKRYRYYVSHRLKTGISDKASGWRVPAGEMERLVLRQALDLLRNRSLLAGWLHEHLTSDRIEPGLAAADEMARSLAEGDSNQRRQILHLIFKKITLSPTGIHLVVDRQVLVHRLDGKLPSSVDTTDDPQPFVIERKIAIKRRGVETRLIIDGPADNELDSSSSILWPGRTTILIGFAMDRSHRSPSWRRNFLFIGLTSAGYCRWPSCRRQLPMRFSSAVSPQILHHELSPAVPTFHSCGAVRPPHLACERTSQPDRPASS